MREHLNVGCFEFAREREQRRVVVLRQHVGGHRVLQQRGRDGGGAVYRVRLENNVARQAAVHRLV